MRLGDLLMRAGVVTQEQLDGALEQQASWGGKLGSILVRMRALSEDLLVKALSRQLNIPRADLSQINIPPPPKEIALPQVPVEAAEGDEDTEDDMAPTTFDSFEDMPPPPPPSSGGGDVFLAFDEAPQLIYFESPEYPPLARDAGIEGTVAVKVLVNEQGKVVSAEVLQSDVTPAMERAAVAAAKKCKFRPAKQRTIAVRAHVMIPFQFQLTN